MCGYRRVWPRRSSGCRLKLRTFSERLASLTPQQFRVLGMLAEGLLNKQIAYDLDVSEATIKAHITAVFRKLGVRNRTQAVIAIQQMELDPSDQSLSGG